MRITLGVEGKFYAITIPNVKDFIMNLNQWKCIFYSYYWHKYVVCWIKTPLIFETDVSIWNWITNCL
jgi:hypothetical protein